MESVGRLAAGVAHEVKNPLAIILMGVDYLMKCLPSGEKSSLEVIKDIGLAAKRADTVVRGLLDFSASERLDSELQDLNKVIEISLMLVKHEMIKKRIFLSKDLASPLPLLKLDKSKIEQVFINIFMNAIQAMNDGGSLLVRTNLDKSHGAGQSWVVAEIEDSGCGISPDKLSKVFDPFYTTKPTGQGTGLGLSVSKKIVELHGGELRMSNRPEGGIRTKLMLPVR
jgi:signal transduction histidine kinase